MNNKHESANLDILRSMAVGLVFSSHFVSTIGNGANSTPWEPAIAGLGTFGVLMFFIHTRRVLMMSLERLERSDVSHVTWSFYVRRVFRIYPASILTVLLISLLEIPALPWGEFQ